MRRFCPRISSWCRNVSSKKRTMEAPHARSISFSPSRSLIPCRGLYYFCGMEGSSREMLGFASSFRGVGDGALDGSFAVTWATPNGRMRSRSFG